jgi:hypothetical protein
MRDMFPLPRKEEGERKIATSPYRQGLNTYAGAVVF